MYLASTSNCPAPDAQGRIASALDRTIRDTTEEFDECLFDRLLDSAQSALRSSTKIAEKLISLYQICGAEACEQVNTFRLLKAHKNFVAANQNQVASRDDVIRLSKSFLIILPDIIKRNKLNEVTAALFLISDLHQDILHIASLDETNFHVVMVPHDCCPRFGDPTDQTVSNQTDKYEISSILELVRYFMITGRNHNILKVNNTVLLNYTFSLIANPRSRPMVEELKQLLEELIIIVRTPVVYEFLDNLFLKCPNAYLGSELIQHIRSLLNEAFKQTCQSPPPAYILNAIAATLALAKFPSREVVPKLKQLNSMDAIMMFADNVNVFQDLQLSHFIFYPILMQCNSDEAHELIGRQFMTRKERLFIERNIRDYHVLKSLLYLKNVITGCHKELPDVSYKRLIYMLDVTLEYLKANYGSPMKLKNLLECCAILQTGQKKFTLKNDFNWSFYLMHHLLILASGTDLSARPDMLQIFLSLLQLISATHYFSSVFKTSHKVERLMRNWHFVVVLARKQSDSRVLYEIAQMFHLARKDLSEAKDHQMEQYVELIWEHMLPLARQLEDHDLIGCLVSLLIRIDMDVKRLILDKFHIARHHTIPMLIADLLREFSFVSLFTDRILLALNNENTEDLNEPSTKVGYLEWLDVNVALINKKQPLNDLLKVVCLVMQGESSRGPKEEALLAINNLIDSFLLTEDDIHKVFDRLVRTGVLEMIYELSNCSLQSKQVQNLAVVKVSKINKHVIKKLGSKEDATIALLKLLAVNETTIDGTEYNEQNRLRQARASKIINFFVSINANKRIKGDQIPPTTEVGDSELGLNSYLNDILDYRRTDWGPSECY